MTKPSKRAAFARPDRKGVAVIIDIDTVNRFGADGPFQMEREPG